MLKRHATVRRTNLNNKSNKAHQPEVNKLANPKPQTKPNIQTQTPSKLTTNKINKQQQIQTQTPKL